MQGKLRGRVLGLAVVMAALVVVAWALGVWGGGHEPASSSTPSGAPDASQTPAPPTQMPDGAPIPSPSPGTPSTLGAGSAEPVELVPTNPPVRLDETGDFGTGLTVSLTEIESVQGVARAPGEIAGPALEVTVEATNDSAEAISLDGVIVFLSYGKDRTPATDFGQGSEPLRDDLAPRSSVTGTYVFAVPEDQRGDVRVEISYSGEAPAVAFEGSVD